MMTTSAFSVFHISFFANCRQRRNKINDRTLCKSAYCGKAIIIVISAQLKNAESLLIGESYQRCRI